MTFRWKDYAHGSKKRKMTLAAEEFIRWSLLHVLPKGLVRIRYYGWVANRRRRECVAKCRARLAADEPSMTEQRPDRRCPRCGGAVETVEVIVPRELRRRRFCRQREPDSS